MYGPVIQGKLVRLRPPKPEDAEVMIGWFEDLETTRFLALQNPPSIEMEKQWLETTAKDPNSVIWVMEVGGVAVGTTGIREIDWKNGFGTTGTLIGDRSVWGQGVGSEAMRLRAVVLFRRQRGERQGPGGCGLPRGWSSSRRPLCRWAMGR